MRKKASLNLSINAIVVIILAITMLGLGLGFMRNTFGGVSEQFESVSDQMKQEMVESLKSSTEVAKLNAYEVNVKRGKTKNIYFGVKNSGTSTCTATFTITQPATGIGSQPWGSSTVKAPSTISIDAGDVQVIPIQISIASDTNPDTYQAQIALTGCGTKTETFYITVE
ncbi:hypothetical protein D6745_02095 [Candidatus Woesearchaeota archaeon]|nr:MAG: hypothetical protein D6745_02095 [Candidatus Woesearchaeota archaeon]